MCMPRLLAQMRCGRSEREPRPTRRMMRFDAPLLVRGQLGTGNWLAGPGRYIKCSFGFVSQVKTEVRVARVFDTIVV